MISVYDIGNEAFDKNGNVVLEPKKGTVRLLAGGSLDLTMDVPMDAEGKWKHLQKEAVVKAPVPKETITTAYTGMEADVYLTTEAAALRSGPSEPSIITYSAWVSGTSYAIGTKVTNANQNYQLNQELTGNEIYTPPGSSGKWAKIARTSPGSPLLVNLKSGTELYYVSGPDDGWYVMCTTYGLEGYIKSTQVQYDRHMEPGEIKPRVITDQLFRIKKVTVNSENQTVSVNARHVSYDLNGVLIDNVKIVRKGPAESLAWIQQAFMMPYRGIIATDMITNENKDYSAEISGKNGMYALLDPDRGVVSCFDAEFRRDNWDLFVMAKTETDRGFRIRYGNNMKGINWTDSSEPVILRVVPVAKNEDGSDLYLDPVKWVDSEDISSWPVVYMERLKVNGQVGKDDGSETDTTWTVQTLRAEMEKQARARFEVDKCDKGLEEITVDFEMLGNTAEHPWLKDLQSILLYDTVIAIDERTGISVSVTVSELEYDIVKEKVTGAKMTNVKHYGVKNVNGFMVLDNTITGEKLTDEAGDALMGSAVDMAAEYTDEKASETLSASKSYVGDRHGYDTFESYIKAYCDNRYVRQ